MADDYINRVSYKDEATNTTTTYEIQATSSSNATTADKLSCGSVGSLSVPVYFQSSGVPNECSRLSLDTSGNAASADKLNTNAGSSTQPVYFSNGVPVAGIKFTYSGGVLNITT